jgi:WD40 repeat protein
VVRGTFTDISTRSHLLHSHQTGAPVRRECELWDPSRPMRYVYIALASKDHLIRIWDATSGQAVAAPFTGDIDSVSSVVISPDRQQISSASWGGTIRVWGVASGKVVAGPFIGPTNSDSFVAFSQDRQRIALTSSDGTTCVWDVATGQLVAGPFSGQSPVENRNRTGSDPVYWTHRFAHICCIFSGRTTQCLGLDRLRNSCGEGYGRKNFEFSYGFPSFTICLHRPSTVRIAGKHETRLDVSKFVRGSTWVTVHDHNLSK